MKRLTKDEIDRIVAYVLTRLCWRDTGTVEDSHAGISITCDMAFYKEANNTVSKELKTWIKQFTDEFRYQLKHYKTDPDCGKRENARLFDFYAIQWHNWDPPILIKTRYRGDLTDFLLQGDVLKACQEHNVLDDRTMCVLNHDVYNRMYTLVHRGHIDLWPD